MILNSKTEDEIDRPAGEVMPKNMKLLSLRYTNGLDYSPQVKHILNKLKQNYFDVRSLKGICTKKEQLIVAFAGHKGVYQYGISNNTTNSGLISQESNRSQQSSQANL